jgi:phosphoribosylaminoimidazole (AIR) synthetase
MRNTGLFHRSVLPIGASLVFLVSYAARSNAQVGIAAQVAEETREACTPDAMRLCGDYIPDVPKITSCMQERFYEISSPCRAAMIREHYRARARLRKARVSTGD